MTGTTGDAPLVCTGCNWRIREVEGSYVHDLHDTSAPYLPWVKRSSPCDEVRPARAFSARRDGVIPLDQL